MPQWPLSREKLAAARELVQEQLMLEHIEPSVSPWNTPIFVIKKKSGKWRLLHDLRAVNRQMQLMGPVQRGLPLLSSLPKGWPMLVVDIKDCFFSIPLHSLDRERFAFTLPSENHEMPDARYQWKVLPQGMANSPTLCQLYVNQAIAPVRKQFSQVRIIHYMDDILITAHSQQLVDKAFALLSSCLNAYGLSIAPEKIQQSDVVQFLGAKITTTSIRPQKLCISTQNLCTLNDFQKLLGDINWLRGYLPLTRNDLQPLFSILEGNPDIASPRQLTPEGVKALQLVEKAISKAQLCRFDPSKKLLLCILATPTTPTGVVWQNAPLWWIHGNSAGVRTLRYYPELVAHYALLGLKFCTMHFGKHPDELIVPYTQMQIETLAGTTNVWPIVLTAFSGVIDNHLPADKLLTFVQRNLVYFPKLTKSKPIPAATTIYTDGSKTGRGAYATTDSEPVILHFRPNAPQVVECLVVLTVFRTFSDEPINIISDSQYVVNAVRSLEVVAHIQSHSTVAPIFRQIQQAILVRRMPFFIGHIRAHSGLPGPMSKTNAKVDIATRNSVFVSLTSVDLAKNFHASYHVPANTLRLRFHISREQARQIVKACPDCAIFLHPPHSGVNPRGLKPLSLWQMDVTHIPEFGRQKYVHVSVDTYSGVIHATSLSGERVAQVKLHCLEAWAAWGKPALIKTDNGPAYTSKGFATFMSQMQVAHKTGLPYNPQGQGIVERANRSLKETLQKQRGGIALHATPRERLAIALYTLNFLHFNTENESAAMRHTKNPVQTSQKVMWKDVLDNKWYGPDPVIQRSRGAICVFPQERPDPIWIPERLTRRVTDKKEEERQENTRHDNETSDMDTDGTMVDISHDDIKECDPVGHCENMANT